MYWDWGERVWTDRGCYWDRSTSHLTATVCRCNHTTNFGLIFDIGGALDDWSATQIAILNYLSTVLCSLSILAATATALLLQLSRLPSSPRIMIVKHRAISMIGLFLLFLVGFDREIFHLSINICRGVAAVLHFFALAIFFWTLLEGRQLYRSLTSSQLVDTNSSRYSALVRYIIGYGGPLVISTATLLTSKMLEGEGEDFMHGPDMRYCWLQENTFIYFFVVPAGTIILINTAVFALAVRAASRARARVNSDKASKIFSQVKTWAFLTFLLGHTWAAGFLIQNHLEGFSYVFVILNCSSGIFLFIHTILMNDVIMLEIKIRLGLRDQVELALDNSGSRLTASKSFKTTERGKVTKRPARQEVRGSTSSEETPARPRCRKPPRKVYRAGRGGRGEDLNTSRPKPPPGRFVRAGENQYASTPENTSLSSENSGPLSSYQEQTSSESLQWRRAAALDRRARAHRERRLEQGVVGAGRGGAGRGGPAHDRLEELRGGTRLQRHHSNKW